MKLPGDMTFRVLAPLILVLAVLFAVGYQVSSAKRQRLYRAQVATCERANDLVRESNARIRAHEADTNGLLDLLATATAARVRAFQETHHQLDKDAAVSYMQIAARVKAKARFKAVALVDCQATIQRP